MNMNITLICNNIQLYNEFMNSQLFSSVKIGQDLNTDDKYDCIIILDKMIEYNKLLELLEENKIKSDNIFYILSSEQNEQHISSIKYVLKSKNVEVIPPRLTEKQIFDRVCDKFKIDLLTNNNVILFFGADSKVGTTITSQAVAEALAENTNYQVCFLNLSGQPSFEYINENTKGYGIDVIKTKIFNSILSKDELKSVMITKGNLSILPSVKLFTDLRHYQPSHAEYLIDLASSLFDIVIVDAGYCPNSGLYIGALNSTKQRYMVATQQESCINMFNMVKNQIFDLLDIDTNSIFLVINRFNNELHLSNFTKITNEVYKMVLAAILPNVPGGFWLSEVNKQTLRNLSSEYRKSLDNLVKIIAEQLGIKYKPPENKTKFNIPLLNIFKKKVANNE